MALPRLEGLRTADAKAMAQALEKSLEPVVKEILNTVKDMIDKLSDDELKANRETLGAHSIDFAIERLTEAIEDMKPKDGEAEPDLKDVVEMMKGFSDKKADEQMMILKDIMKSSQVSATFGKKLVDDISKDMTEALDKLIAIETAATVAQMASASEMMKIEKDRDRIINRGNAEKRARPGQADDTKGEKTLLDKLLSMFTSTKDGGFMGMLMKGFDKILFGAGAIGLLSLIPKTFREFIDEYIVAFTEVRAMLQNSWLKPLFKIIEGLPIIGAIVKKLPILSAILGAFDIIPKMFEKYQTDGWWGAIEAGLQGLYKFFVGDIVKLGGKIMDWMVEKLFGPDIAAALSFEGWAETFNDAVEGVILGFIDSWKKLFSGDFSGFAETVAKTYAGIVNGIVNSLSALFKWEPGMAFNISEKYDEWMKRAKEADEADAARAKAKREEWMNWFKSFDDEWFKGTKEAWTAWAGKIKDDSVAAVTKVAGDWMTWIQTSITDALSAAVDIKEDIKNWLQSLWKGVSDWLYDSTIGQLPGMAREKEAPGPVSTGPKVDRYKTLETQIAKKGMALQFQGLAPRGGGATVIQNSQKNQNSTNISNYSVSGPANRASLKNPLAASVGNGWGGGGGGGW